MNGIESNIIKSYEENEYLIEEYDNGMIVKTLISDIIEEEIIEEEISKQELFNLEILSKLEYLTCIQQTNNEFM